MLTPEQVARLAALRGSYVNQAFLEDFYGLQPDSALMGAFRAWAARYRRREAAEKPSGEVHRHAIETFFQTERLLPMRWAAARVGMTQRSLEEVLTQIRADDPFLPKGPSEQLIPEQLLGNLSSYFPALRNRLFSDHHDFCRELHEAILTTMGLDVEALHCVTAKALGEPDPDYVHDVDAITLEPMGLRYQVWLDFKKPMSLRPDACSLLLYARERPLLSPYLFGSEPQIPAGLAAPPAAP
jgi:hypothetical protein